jgi:predicted ArsR family transcriptional regulator
MAMKTFRKALDAVTSLSDPTRRRLYEAVASSTEAVSRNELARMTGVARPVVAYHLDRLVKDGLLETRFERQSGRVGPGAGRTAKLYFRRRTPVKVTLPSRDIEFAAQLLLNVVAQSNDPGVRASLDRLARQAGTEIANVELQEPQESPTEAVIRLLTERGYEPRTDSGGTTWLGNCVFDELADQERQLVCGMNLSLVRGILDALPEAEIEARLEPGEGRCCVVLAPKDPAASQ